VVQINKFKNGFTSTIKRTVSAEPAFAVTHNAFCVSTATEHDLRLVSYLLQVLTEKLPVLTQQICKSVQYLVATLTFSPVEFKDKLGQVVLRHAAPALAMFELSLSPLYI
jgi:hypothetical protein